MWNLTIEQYIVSAIGSSSSCQAQCTHKEKRLHEHMNLTSITELIIVIVALFIAVISFVVYSCTCDSIAHINDIFFLWIELRKINNIY